MRKFMRWPVGVTLLTRNLTLVTISLIVVVLAANLPAPVITFAATLPQGFQQTTVFSGLDKPTDIQFATDGRIFIAEKGGKIKIFDSLTDTTPTIFADLETNVHNFWDRGLLGLALDPAFPTEPYVYALYTYDADFGGTPPRWDDQCPDPPGATDDGCVVLGRLSRLEASGDSMIGQEYVLVEDWCQQYPSHSIGAVEFGRDGALYASAGDGASFGFPDYGQKGAPLNPCNDPPSGIGGNQNPPHAEGGALRSQDIRTDSDPASLDGAIIRVDPDTGAALPDNPLYSSNDPNAQRIIAYGLRNPFRFAVRPGTDELWISDVGWGTWEELNVVTNTNDDIIENFGWPCYEGPSRQSRYDSRNLTICENLYSEADAHTDPFYAYRHADKVVPGEECPTGGSSIAGLAFYTSGDYPSEYDGALFFSDYSRRCIWVMFADEDGNPDPSTRTTFISSAARPVSLKIGPNGDLFYIDIGGTVRRIQYFSGNQPPTASIDADPTSGIAPLTVSFDASNSSDPDPDDTLTYAWDLDGDGDYDDSTEIDPTYDYEEPGSYMVRLRVTDSMGDADTDSIIITANNTPPTAIIETPLISDTWRVGDSITFSGEAEDTQDENLPASAFAWEILLHHCYSPTNCHIHPLIDTDGVKSGTFNAPDHEYPSYLEIQLTVTDSGGLQDSTTIQFYPETVDLSFESEPPGITMGLNSITTVTPFTQTVIIGSSNAVDTPAMVEIDGITYTFDEWSDESERSHTIVAGEDSATYTATYTYEQSIGFPITNVLDDFDRPDGPLGPAWVGNTTGYGVEDNTLTMANGGSVLMYWGETFGPDQEAYVTLTSINDNANEIDLLLKGQGTSQCDVLEVLYNPQNEIVQVWTCHNYGNWIQHGTDLSVSFQEGDLFGARARADGTVEIYQNDTLVGSVTVSSSWPYRGDGGRIGIWTINAQGTIMDDFGGGTP